MAEHSEGGGLADSLLPSHMTLGAFSESESIGDRTLSEETGASILGDFLQIEGTAAELKEEESNIIKALADCGDTLEEAEEDYNTDDDEGDEESDGDDEDDDESDDESGEDDEDGDKGDDEALDFGGMPDFSDMLKAELPVGPALLDEAVASKLELSPMEESEFMDSEDKPEAGTCDRKIDAEKKGKKRKRTKSGDGKSKKSKQRKKKKKKSRGSKVDSKSLKASDKRRNIRKIIGEKDLEKETLNAQKEELERQQRLMELKRQAMAGTSSTRLATGTSGSGVASSAVSVKKEQDPQLKSLLQSAEEEAEKIEKREIEKKKAELIAPADIKKEVEEEAPPPKEDVILLSSDSEAESDDDDCVVVQSSEEEEKEEDVEPEDVNDGGSHVKDDQNCRDDQGRVLVNLGHPTDDPDIFLAPQMARVIKPHQIGGVRFLYDNLVESLPRFDSSSGFGCILAHSMGLGKTIQVISFVDIFLQHTTAKKVLIIVPINTLQNWMAEFNMWAPAEHQPPPPAPKTKKGEKAEKKPRERAKKSKEPSKGTKGKGGRGKKAASTANPAGQRQDSMSHPDLGMGPGGLGPSCMSGGEGQGANSMDRPGMGRMGNMRTGGMDPMSAPGPIPMASPMGPMSGSAMNFMGNCNIGPMGGPPMGQSSYMQGLNVNQMGSCGGSFQEMPWMNSPMSQPACSPFGPPQHNPGMRMPASSNQSGMNNANPFTSRPCASDPKDFASYGSPMASFSNSSTVNSSGYMTDTSSPFPTTPSPFPTTPSPFPTTPSPFPNTPSPFPNTPSPFPATPMGSMMEADRYSRADNAMMGWQGSSPHGSSCQGGLMGSSMDTSNSANSVGPLGVSHGNPVTGLSMDSSMNSSVSAPTNGEHLTNNASSLPPMEDGLERFMGPGFMDGGTGNINDGGMGSGLNNPFSSLQSVSSTGNRMGTSPSVIPTCAQSPFGQIHTGSAMAQSSLGQMNTGSSLTQMNVGSPMNQQSLSQMNTGSPGMTGSPRDSSTIPSAVLDAAASTVPSSANETSNQASVEVGMPSAALSAPCPSAIPDTCSKDGKAEGEADKGTEGQDGNAAEEGKDPSETESVPKNEEGKDGGDDTQKTEANNVRYRDFNIFLLNDSCKATAQRAKIISDWDKEGGVLLMGYEMFRLLHNSRNYGVQAKKRSRAKNCKQKPDVIDVDEEDKNKNLMIDIHSALVNPGPDLVICDEGHRIKNNHASISRALKQIHTKRRVVLTGYPLQNNLMEYWCMVDFVRPNYLGNKTEFSNMFERPIMNGQCQDSTNTDRKLMKQRAYVLHNLLEGFVQRRSHVVLQRALPMKHEYVFLVRMSPIQRKLYRRYIDSLENNASLMQATTNPLKAFSVGCKIWNHPDILHKSILLKKPVVEDNDLDIEAGEGVEGKKRTMKKTESTNSLASMTSSVSNATLKSSVSTLGISSMNLDTPSPSSSTCGAGTFTQDAPTNSADPEPDPGADPDSDGDRGVGSPGLASAMETGTNTLMVDKKEDDHAWVGDAFEEYEAGVLEHGPKMVLLSTLIEEALRNDDKILVFSQSLSTLDTIEEFLSKHKVPRPDMDENWAKNKSYFRLDGSTSGLERERLINEFNRPTNKAAWVFLLSTKAGCLGINLIGANRAVVLDASWNPCHDCQAVCRVFRFGQSKECFIYRLVTENTLERNIYDRQITKQGMADRVVDEMNTENPFSRKQLQNLLKNEDKDFPYIDFSHCDEYYDDPVMVSTLKKQGQWITKEPFTHESLLIDRKELRMTKKEKKLAQDGYARDKRMNVTYSRPSYAAYYPGAGGAVQRYIRRTPQPISSIRPMISTPGPRPGVHLIKPGVSVQQIATTTDIVLPGTNTSTDSGSAESTNKIAAGQKILVIKTPKGVYIRTNDGKMFAVRSKSADADKSDSGDPTASDVFIGETTTTTTTSISSGSRGVMSNPHHPSFFRSPSSNSLMDQGTYSLPGSSREARNMFPSSPFSPNIRGRGIRGMIHPPYISSGRGRSRLRGAGSMANMGERFPFSGSLSPQRGGRGRGGDLAPFPMGVPPSLHRSQGHFRSSPDLSNLPFSKEPPFTQRPALSGHSQMMKLLASDKEGEKVARSSALPSGSLSSMPSGADLNADPFSQDNSQSSPDQACADVDRNMDRSERVSGQDMDTNTESHTGGDLSGNKDMENSRDSGDMNNSGDMDNNSQQSSPNSISDEMMEEYMQRISRSQGPFPDSWGMEDMDDFSHSSSDSSFQHMPMTSMPGDDASHGATPALSPSQYSSHSPVPPRHNFTTDLKRLSRDEQMKQARDQALKLQEMLDIQAQQRRMMDQSMIRSSLSQQVMMHSPQAHHPHSPQSSQAMVRSPLSHSSHSHSPLPHSPLTQQTHSPGPSVSQRTHLSMVQSSQLAGNSHSASLHDEDSGPGSSPASDASVSNQSNPLPSFRGLPSPSSQHAHYSQQSPTAQSQHSQQSQQSIHDDPTGHVQTQGAGHHGRQASFLQRQQGPPQPMDPMKSLSPSSHLQAPESWSHTSHSSPVAYSSQQQAEQGQHNMHPVPPQQDDDSSQFSLNQGDSPMSDEWMNSDGWAEDGTSGQGEDQDQFMGQAGQDLPPPSPAQQALADVWNNLHNGMSNSDKYQAVWKNHPPVSQSQFDQREASYPSSRQSQENMFTVKENGRDCQQGGRRKAGFTPADKNPSIQNTLSYPVVSSGLMHSPSSSFVPQAKCKRPDSAPVPSTVCGPLAGFPDHQEVGMSTSSGSQSDGGHRTHMSGSSLEDSCKVTQARSGPLSSHSSGFVKENPIVSQPSGTVSNTISSCSLSGSVEDRLDSNRVTVNSHLLRDFVTNRSDLNTVFQLSNGVLNSQMLGNSVENRSDLSTVRLPHNRHLSTVGNDCSVNGLGSDNRNDNTISNGSEILRTAVSKNDRNTSGLDVDNENGEQPTNSFEVWRRDADETATNIGGMFNDVRKKSSSSKRGRGRGRQRGSQRSQRGRGRQPVMQPLSPMSSFLRTSSSSPSPSPSVMFGQTNGQTGVPSTMSVPQSHTTWSTGVPSTMSALQSHTAWSSGVPSTMSVPQSHTTRSSEVPSTMSVPQSHTNSQTLGNSVENRSDSSTVRLPHNRHLSTVGNDCSVNGLGSDNRNDNTTSNSSEILRTAVSRNDRNTSGLDVDNENGEQPTNSFEVWRRDADETATNIGGMFNDVRKKSSSSKRGRGRGRQRGSQRSQRGQGRQPVMQPPSPVSSFIRTSSSSPSPSPSVMFGQTNGQTGVPSTMSVPQSHTTWSTGVPSTMSALQSPTAWSSGVPSTMSVPQSHTTRSSEVPSTMSVPQSHTNSQTLGNSVENRSDSSTVRLPHNRHLSTVGNDCSVNGLGSDNRNDNTISNGSEILRTAVSKNDRNTSGLDVDNENGEQPTNSFEVWRRDADETATNIGGMFNDVRKKSSSSKRGRGRGRQRGSQRSQRGRGRQPVMQPLSPMSSFLRTSSSSPSPSPSVMFGQTNGQTGVPSTMSVPQSHTTWSTGVPSTMSALQSHTAWSSGVPSTMSVPQSHTTRSSEVPSTMSVPQSHTNSQTLGNSVENRSDSSTVRLPHNRHLSTVGNDCSVNGLGSDNRNDNTTSNSSEILRTAVSRNDRNTSGLDVDNENGEQPTNSFEVWRRDADKTATNIGGMFNDVRKKSSSSKRGRGRGRQRGSQRSQRGQGRQPVMQPPSPVSSFLRTSSSSPSPSPSVMFGQTNGQTGVPSTMSVPQSHMTWSSGVPSTMSVPQSHTTWSSGVPSTMSVPQSHTTWNSEVPSNMSVPQSHTTWSSGVPSNMSVPQSHTTWSSGVPSTMSVPQSHTTWSSGVPSTMSVPQSHTTWSSGVHSTISVPQSHTTSSGVPSTMSVPLSHVTWSSGVPSNMSVRRSHTTSSGVPSTMSVPLSHMTWSSGVPSTMSVPQSHMTWSSGVPSTMSVPQSYISRSSGVPYTMSVPHSSSAIVTVCGSEVPGSTVFTYCPSTSADADLGTKPVPQCSSSNSLATGGSLIPNTTTPFLQFSSTSGNAWGSGVPEITSALQSLSTSIPSWESELPGISFPSSPSC